MSKKQESLEFYQELTISFNASSREAVGEKLEKCKSRGVWIRETEVESRLEESNLLAGRGVLAFERRDSADGPSVQVSLWPVKREINQQEVGFGYRLGNIVPLEHGSLGIVGYNDALAGFINDVIEPARETMQIMINLTPRKQTLSDWTSDEAADALTQFSNAANMSTGMNHPADAARWRAFVIADHRSKKKTLSSDKLRRWLIEVERWPEDDADDLTTYWEFGKELLIDYDEAD